MNYTFLGSTDTTSYDNSGVNPNTSGGVAPTDFAPEKVDVPPPPPVSSSNSDADVTAGGSAITPPNTDKIDDGSGIASYLPMIGLGLLLFLALSKRKR